MSDVPTSTQNLLGGSNESHSIQLSPGAISAISGATAGLISGIVVCPLDVIKTRMQVQGSFGRLRKYTGVWPAMKLIVAEEGVGGLYRGLGPLVVGYLPTWAIYFYVYGKARRNLEPKLGTNSTSSIIISAVTAGATSTMATNPIWMLKTRLMAQSPQTSWHYTGMADAIRQIWTKEGFLQFYSGLTPALLGLPHVAIQFPLYETMKHKFGADTNTGLRSTFGYLCASVCAKVIASTITYPHEVIRARNQIITPEGRKYRGILPTIRVLYLEEGWRVFYAGLATNICRAVPASAVTLVTFELISNKLTARFAPDSKSPR